MSSNCLRCGLDRSLSHRARLGTLFTPFRGTLRKFTTSNTQSILCHFTMGDNLPSFEYIERFKQLVCSICHFGVQDRDRHLQEQHHVPVDQRRKILAAYNRFKISRADQIVYLDAPIAHITCLGVPQTCLACTVPDCDFVRTNERELRSHAYTIHQWRSNTAERTLWRPVKAQTLFRDRKSLRYFVVYDNDVSSNAVDNSSSQPLDSQTSRSFAPSSSHSNSLLTVRSRKELFLPGIDDTPLAGFRELCMRLPISG